MAGNEEPRLMQTGMATQQQEEAAIPGTSLVTYSESNSTQTSLDQHQDLQREESPPCLVDPPPSFNRSITEPILNSQNPRPSVSFADRPNQGRVHHEYRRSLTVHESRPQSAAGPVYNLDIQLQVELQKIQESQAFVPKTHSGQSKSPELSAFRKHFPFVEFESFRIGENSSITKIILVLHDYGGNEKTLADFAEQYLRQPETLYIILRGVSSTSDDNVGYHWADSREEPNGSFINATRSLLGLICQVLIKESNICPSNIILFGHGQGGMAALSVAAAWKKVEFGGVISIGGSMPDHFEILERPDIKTPILVMGGKLGDVNATAKARMKRMIINVDVRLSPDLPDELPSTPEEIKILYAYLEHRLRRTEWTKPSVLTLGMMSLVLRTWR